MLTPERERREISKALAKSSRRVAAAAAQLETARLELRELLVRGRAAGLTVTEMCRLAEISRETAHKLLRQAASAPVTPSPTRSKKRKEAEGNA